MSWTLKLVGPVRTAPGRVRPGRIRQLL